MTKHVDYYFSPSSPWTYLGHRRFAQIAHKHGAQIALKPVDYGVIFPQSGGLPLGKRAPQRQAYRLMELKRWRAQLDVPLTLQPKFFPVDASPAALAIIAAAPSGVDAQMKLAGAIMRALWAEEKNIAEPPTLRAAAAEAGLDADRLLAAAPAAKAKYDAYTQEALARGVFGAPTYVYRDELFWGQDRLDFLERALAT
ncbi:MAG TPA: 2-hydroxychromene-2-carboxylate isomerase [Burkholderiales bacterium]|nr:2-hydroxychromene-2-carboxylate isomerase [Burkholderiales bacterium]